MSKGVLPVKVSPLIKGARFTFLLAGWFYGVNKKALLTAFEKTEKVKRKAKYDEELRLKKLKTRESDISNLKDAFNDLGYEPEPNWEDSLN